MSDDGKLTDMEIGVLNTLARAGGRIQQKDQRIAELEQQVMRLREAFFGLAEVSDAEALGETLGLHPGDLDPVKGEGDDHLR